MPDREFTNINGIKVCDQTARDNIPTKTSQLTNDSGYITNIPDEYITEAELNAKRYATTSQIPTVPTNVSEFANDAHYASETYVNNKIAEASLSGGEVDLSGYVTKETGNASQITFADGQTFQAKLDNGTLKGEKGDKGEQGIQGLKGDKGKQGPQGPKGDTGATPNITIGTVSTLNAGSNATASITGTAPNLTLNLGIPKGEKGDKGDTGGDGTGGSIDTSNLATKTEVNEKLSQKQDKLVSGTNIKTINGQSLLGNGDIQITGGSTEGPGTETIETDVLSLMTYGKAVEQNAEQGTVGSIVNNASCWATVNPVSVTEGQEYTLTMDGTWMWVFTYDDSDNFVS